MSKRLVKRRSPAAKPCDLVRRQCDVVNAKGVNGTLEEVAGVSAGADDELVEQQIVSRESPAGGPTAVVVVLDSDALADYRQVDPI